MILRPAQTTGVYLADLTPNCPSRQSKEKSGLGAWLVTKVKLSVNVRRV